MIKRFGIVIGCCWLLLVGGAAQQGSPPVITTLIFPAKIPADGSFQQGTIGFQDPDGDVIKVQFEVVRGDPSSIQIQPGFEFDPQVKGQKEGIIPFSIATTVAQQVTLRVTLFDEGGNKSLPSEINFVAIAVQRPDLTVDSISLTPESPMEGDEVRISAVMRNIGEAEATDVKVAFEVDGREISRTEIRSLSVGSSQSVEMPETWKAVAGEHVIRVVVDPENRIEEINEGNNDLTKKITIFPRERSPVACFTFSPAAPYVGEPVTFDASCSYDPDGRIDKYEWDFTSDGRIDATGMKVTNAFPAAGQFQVTLKVADNDGLSNSVSKPITISPPPVVAEFTANPTSGPAPLTVQFTNKSKNFTSSLWDFGDGGTSEETNPRYTYRRPGSYTVKLTVRGPGGEATAVKPNFITVMEVGLTVPRDYKKIQWAINAAKEGTIIFVEAGIYQENLTITKSLTLRGAGKEQTKIEGKEGGTPVIHIESSKVIEVTIEGMTISGAKRYSSANLCAPGNICPNGIQVQGKAKLILTDFQISGNGNNGIDIGDLAQAAITNSQVSGNSADGIHMEGSAQATVTNSQISGNGSSGIHIGNSARATITNSQISGNSGAGVLTDAGILVGGSGQATITDSQISGNKYNGIRIESLAQATITDSRVSENSDNGIWVGGSAQATITNSQASENGDNGISIYDSAQATIQNSTVSGNGWGIRIWGSAQATISNSQIFKNKYDGINIYDSAHATIQNNKIFDNERYGVAVSSCFGPPFKGEIKGSGNEIYNNGERNLCPPPGQYSPWPTGFGGGA